MLFNSIEFFIFLVLVVSIYYRLGYKNQNIWLLVASYVFYGWWDWRFLALIFLSTTADFTISNRMGSISFPRRKYLLWISIGLNLGLLATFKYFNFFVDSFIDMGLLIGLNMDTPALRLLPPVGISFYTFQTLSYTVDVYKRRIAPETNFITFALFVSYFPQLVAGPIERARRLLPQLNSPRNISPEDIKCGLTLILIGLFKKIVIADTAGVRVDELYANPAHQSSLSLTVAAVLFMLQIYGDFSGYSNIARGTSRLLGIKLIENFKTPYLSRNISEFWKRWHVSLSEWLRDYLYIQLGGNRGSTLFTARNLMATMMIGGLWHGAAWTFVVWGFLNGIYLIIHRYWRLFCDSNRPHQNPTKPAKIQQYVKLLTHTGSVFLTASAVMIAFVFFRADTFDHAWEILYGIASIRGPISISELKLPILLILLLAPIELQQYRNKDRLLAIREIPFLVRTFLYTGMCLCLLLASHNDKPFIYFQF